MLLHVRQVGVLAGRIDDHQQVVARAGHHQIVEDAAGVVGELGVALLARLQAGDVARHQRLHRLRGALAGLRGEPHLAHVRDVEQAAGGASVVVLDQDAGRILDRHLVAGEGHQARAQLAMKIVKRRALQGAGGGFGQKSLRRSRVERDRSRAFTTQGLRRSRPPLSGDLKDSPGVLPGRAGLLRRWACAEWGARHFPETHPPAVRLPESFRGRLLLRRHPRGWALPQGSSGWTDHRQGPVRRPRTKARSTMKLRENESTLVIE